MRGGHLCFPTCAIGLCVECTILRTVGSGSNRGVSVKQFSRRLQRHLGATALVIACCLTGPVHAADAAATDDEAAAALADFVGNLEKSAIVGEPKIVDCTLSGGARTKCFQVSMRPTPTRHKPGPWCPKNISDGPDTSGIWIEKGKVYDADGAFVANLATFYDDPRWQMFDPATGKVKVTNSKESCAAAARPDVDPKYQNYCVECLTSYLDPQPVLTFVIPVRPIRSDRPGRMSRATGAGVAFNGVRFDEPAPLWAILGAHTLAPFDDCGGHVNLHVGYHYHAATGCTKQVSQPNAHAPLIGMALDGYGLHTLLNEDGTEPKDLDACRGHDFPDIGYHYHVSEPGENQLIGCFSGEHGCVLREAGGTCDATRLPPPPPR